MDAQGAFDGRRTARRSDFHLCLFKRFKRAQRPSPENLAVGREADDPRRPREQTSAEALFNAADQLANRRGVKGKISCCSGETSRLDNAQKDRKFAKAIQCSTCELYSQHL
ncbi:hypothetical protein MAE02_59570 [Microvirga aerophila]|uniref:Uncharacterized protein n=1 Tax=Microvirga aerophila TaxID=670291 RepID=A0A512C229_9HYPH|nr:hypothetical protein MAE02_59570 [Microvirga aerophila]